MKMEKRFSVKTEMAARKKGTLIMIAVKWVILVMVISLTWYTDQWAALVITILTVYTGRLTSLIATRRIVDARLEKMYDASTASSNVE